MKVFHGEPFQKVPVSFCGFTRIRANQKWNIPAMLGLELFNQHSPALTEFKNVFTALRLINYFQNLQPHFVQKAPHAYAYSVMRKYCQPYIIINGSEGAGIEALGARGKGLVVRPHSGAVKEHRGSIVNDLQTLRGLLMHINSDTLPCSNTYCLDCYSH